MQNDKGKEPSDEQKNDPGDQQDQQQDQPWAEAALGLARSLLGDERVEQLEAATGRAGEIGEVTAGAYLNDLRLIEKAEFHRSRRDVARELAVDAGSDELLQAKNRMSASQVKLGALRVQKDQTLRKEVVPPTKPSEAKPAESKPGEAKDKPTKPNSSQEKPK